jgi:hypothetical protein
MKFRRGIGDGTVGQKKASLTRLALKEAAGESPAGRIEMPQVLVITPAVKYWKKNHVFKGISSFYLSNYYPPG